jgi:hypothetical protein
MTTMSTATPRTAARIARPLAALACAIAAAVAAGGCSTGGPGALPRAGIAEARTFPYFKVYWAGPSFGGHPLAAVDGLRSYLPNVGDSVYYGDCVQSKGIFGGGSCLLPLQVTTIVYRLHDNKGLGPQRNVVLRGVPSVLYDGGRSIELYTGRVAIDVFSDTYAHAHAAVLRLLPVNAPGSASADLPLPVYCPELSGPQEPAVERVMQNLPSQSCQRAAATVAYRKAVRGE